MNEPNVHLSRTRAIVAEELRRLLPKMEGFRASRALSFGLSALDSYLPQGGLAGAALHELVPAEGGTAAAFGFVAALLARLSSPATQHQLSPPPLRGRSTAQSAGGWGGISDRTKRTPLPNLSPQGGREQAEFAYPRFKSRSFVFVTPAYGLREYGRLSGHGLNNLGLDPARLILAETAHRKQTLWAMEEALRSRAPAAVAGFIDRLDLKSSQRLHLAATEAGLPLFLLRPALTLESSAAATRWRIGTAEAARDRFGLFVRPRWHLQLERCRNGRPGEWVVEYDHVAHRFSLAAALADPALSRRASDRSRRAVG